MIKLDGTCPYPIRRLDEVAEILDRYRKPVNSAERANHIGPYPYYGANGQVGTIDDYLFDEELVLVAEDGGFFFDNDKPISYRVCGKCWVNNHAHVLRPMNMINADWLNYVIAFQDITDMVKGSTRTKLNQQELRRIKIPLPTLAEQNRIVTRIAEMMVRVDEIRTLCDKADDEAAFLGKSYRFEMWERMLTCGRTQRVSQLVESSRNGLYKPSVYYGTGIPFIRMFNIHDGRCVLDRIERIQADLQEQRVYSLRPGDLLVSRVNSRELVGKSCCYRGLDEPAVFEAMVIRLRAKVGVNPDFLAAIMNTPQFLQRLRGKAKHAIGQSSINQSDLLSMEVPVPAITVQDELSEDVQEFDHVSESIRNQQKLTHCRTAAIKQSILQKAFAGGL